MMNWQHPPPPFQRGFFIFRSSQAQFFSRRRPIQTWWLPGVGVPPSVAAAAGVDDRDNTDITPWFVYEHQTLAQVISTATNNNLRVVDLYVENPVSPYAFTAVLRQQYRFVRQKLLDSGECNCGRPAQFCCNKQCSHRGAESLR